MQCKICKEKLDTDSGIKTKSGVICQSCLDKFPDSVKMHIQNFTVKQLMQLDKLIAPASSKILIESGVFGVGKNCIQIKGIEYQLKDLRSIRLNFHPKELGSHPNTVVGIITVIVETKYPHFLIEEPFFPEDVTVGYGISGKVIFYHYSYEIEQIFEKIQECLDECSYDMTEYIDRYRKAVQKEAEYKKSKEDEKRRAEEAQKKAKEEAEKQKKAEEEKRRREKEERKKKESSSTSYKPKKMSPFEEAKALFGVEMPYTLADIKSRRNKLVRQYHPDNNGGSEEMCKKINEAYTLLSKFATA